MIKKQKFLLILIVFFLFTNTSIAEKNSIKIYYFGNNACISCLKAEKHIQNIIKEKEIENSNVKIDFIYYDLMDKTNEYEELLIKYNNCFNIEATKFKVVPAVFVGNKAFIGYEDIENNFENTLTFYISNISKYENVNINYSDNVDNCTSIIDLTKTGIFLAGLLDGINPCSIAMMLFFISFVAMSKNNSDKNKILWIGLSFSFGTFLAYLGIGIGLFNFIYAFIDIKIIMTLFYILLAIMGLYLGYINILDYKNIKAGKDENIKNQLNKKTKRRIHNIIKKQSNKKMIYLTAFITAFIISFLEFFCTGQVYLPIITYMINNSDKLNYVFLLVFYNFAFITPLLIITFFLYLGEEVIDISTILYTKLHWIKLLGAIFFFMVTIYSLHLLI